MQETANYGAKSFIELDKDKILAFPLKQLLFKFIELFTFFLSLSQTKLINLFSVRDKQACLTFKPSLFFSVSLPEWRSNKLLQKCMCPFYLGMIRLEWYYLQ
jgi:hypothetical protein